MRSRRDYINFPSHFSYAGKKGRLSVSRIGEETADSIARVTEQRGFDSRISFSSLSPSPSFDVVLTFGANFPIRGGRKEGRKEGAKAPLSNEKKNKGAVSHRFVREEGGKRLVGGKVCWRLRYSFIRTLIKATFEVYEN